MTSRMDDSPLSGRGRLARVAPAVGAAGTAAIVAGMVAAGLFYRGTIGQSYRIANHFVSELGEYGVSRLAGIFNGGLIVGGACIIVFVVGLVARLKGWFRWILGPVGLLTGVFGALVGIFPMNMLPEHVFVANGFFYPGLVTMLLFSLYVVASRHQELPRWVAIPGFAAAAALFAFLFLGTAIGRWVNGGGPAPGFGAARPDIWVTALFEWVAIGAVLSWVAAVAVILLVRDQRLPGRAT